MKMHEEMEKMKSQLELAEIDKKKLKEKVQDAPLRPGAKVSVSLYKVQVSLNLSV